MEAGIKAISTQHCLRHMAVEQHNKWQQYNVYLITALNALMLWLAYNVFQQVKENTINIVQLQARSAQYITGVDVERIKTSIEEQVRVVSMKMDTFMSSSHEQQIRFDIEQRNMSGQLTKLENTISRAVLVQPRSQDGSYINPPIIPPKP